MVFILFPVATQQKPPELGSIARFSLPTEGAISLATFFLFPDLEDVSPSVTTVLDKLHIGYCPKVGCVEQEYAFTTFW